MRRFLLALLLLLLADPAAHAASRQRSILQDDRLLLSSGTDIRQRALDTIQSLGADTIRSTVTWDRWRSQGPSDYVSLVSEARARGLSVLLTITGQRTALPSRAQFEAFAQDVATQLPSVHLWSIWNEPNLRFWMGSQRTAPQRYRAYFDAGVAGLRAAGHGGDTILLGETAPRRTSLASSPLAFLSRVLCLKTSYAGCRHPHRLAATGIAHHPYTGNASASPASKGPAGDDVSISTLGRLTSLVDQAGRMGRLRRGLPLWVTEFGFQTRPPDRNAPSPAQAAAFQNWSEWLAYTNRRVVSMSQYGLDDDPSTAAYNTGLRFTNGRPKTPVLAAYRLPIFVVRAGRGYVRVFGQVRPRSGPRLVLVQRRTGTRWRTLKHVQAGGRGFLYPRLRGSGGAWRLAWNGFTSRTAAVH